MRNLDRSNQDDPRLFVILSVRLRAADLTVKIFFTPIRGDTGNV